MFGKRFTRALAVVTTGTLIMTSVAFADEVFGDGDGVEPVSQNALALGAVCSEEDSSGAALVAIRRQANANSNSVFANGSTVTLSAAGSAGLSASFDSGNTVSLPSNWETLGTGVMSSALSLSVTLNTSATGPFGGSVTLTATGTNANGGGQLIRTGTMSVTATVSDCAPPNTPPSVTVSGVAEGASYEFGSVPAATCDVVDVEDGNSSFAATLSPITGPDAAQGLGSRTASCSYTDAGGLSDGASVTYSIVDTTGPSVTAPADITVEGNATGGASLSGGGATAAALTNFLAGATASDTVWGDVSGSISDDAPALFLLGPTTVTFTAIDGSDNSGTGMAIVTVQDTTAPTLQGMPSDMTLSTTDPDGLVVNYTLPTATDIVDPSPDVTCDPVSGSVFNLGTTTVECYAKDASGNQSAVQSFQVTVNYYSSTFLAPINGTPVTNKVKGGRVIPVKVEVFKNFIEDEGTGPVTLQLYKSNGCSTTSVDDVEETVASGSANSGTNFRWEPDGGYWIYNLKTPTAQACYVGIVTLDGSEAGRFLLTVTK